MSEIKGGSVKLRKKYELTCKYKKFKFFSDKKFAFIATVASLRVPCMCVPGV